MSSRVAAGRGGRGQAFLDPFQKLEGIRLGIAQAVFFRMRPSKATFRAAR